jgi:hypothetical protein
MLLVRDFFQNLESLHGREFETVFQKKPFIFLFHDTTKLRFRLETRDISVPISILLLGIMLLVTKKEFSRSMCEKLLGKEWGFPHIASMLMECDDVRLKPCRGDFVIERVKIEKEKPAPVRSPEVVTCAKRSG